MRSALSSMKSTAALAILALPLTGCVPELVLAGLGVLPVESVVPTETVVVIECPPLAPPPAEAVDAIEAAGQPASDWLVDLDNHLTKLDEC
jgi:hypothetical protein